MGKQPSVRDHGGESAGRRSIIRTRENIYSFRCVECQAVRYVIPRELSRAAAPRCTKCGGALEQTEASRQRYVDRSDATRVALGTAGSAGEADPGIRCLVCGKKWSDGSYLAIHLRDTQECRDGYWRDQPIVVVNGLSVIQASLHIEHRGMNSWYVRGTMRSGVISQIVRYSTKGECLKAIAQASPRSGPRE